MIYTNVKQIGNFIYERGYDVNNLPFTNKIEYKPTFYIQTNKKSDWRTLDNKMVSPVNPGSIKDCREWIEKYKDIEGISVYGNENAVYQYISEHYTEEITDFDINKIKLYTIDIETASELGFPDPDTAQEEILLITIQDYSSKKVYTWGSRPFSKIMDSIMNVLMS